MRARSHQPPGRGPLVAHAARGSTTSKTLMLGRCRQYGDPRLLEVTEERNGPSGLRDDDEAYELATPKCLSAIGSKRLFLRILLARRDIATISACLIQWPLFLLTFQDKDLLLCHGMSVRPLSLIKKTSLCQNINCDRAVVVIIIVVVVFVTVCVAIVFFYFPCCNFAAVNDLIFSHKTCLCMHFSSLAYSTMLSIKLHCRLYHKLL